MDSIITNNHVFANGSSLAQTCSTISSSASAQTHLATEQFISECRQESFSRKTEQKLCVAICMCRLTSLVGSDWWASLQRKTRSLEGTCVFHKHVHAFPSPSVLEPAALPSSQSSLCVLVWTSMCYTDLTDNNLFLSYCHTQKSSNLLVLNGIEQIASTSIRRNHWFSRSILHVVRYYR
jgi:hypothetical protein